MPTSAAAGRRLRLTIPLLAGLALLPVVAPLPAEARDSAADTVVVVVSARSDVTQISRLHLADLYLGRSTRFPNGAPATPIDQKPGSADREAFLSAYLGRSEAQMKSHWSRLVFTGRGRPPREAASGQAVRDLVARDPGAIGYLDVRLVDSSLRAVRVE